MQRIEWASARRPAPDQTDENQREPRYNCAAAKGSESSGSSGFIRNARIAPSSSKTIFPRKGNSQFPVLSITNPKTRGEIIAARADPVFIRPLADPENRGAMSIGMAHMGPMVNSEKKKARLRQMAAPVRLWENRIGTVAASEHRKPKTTRSRRAFLRSPVLCKTRSLTQPPSASPRTPAKKTPAEKNAEFLKSSR